MNSKFKKTRKFFCVLLAISIVSMTFIPVHGTPKTKGKSANQPNFTSDAVVREWNQIAFTTIPPQPPFPANRWMAIVQLAVFEAVNAVTGRYDPYLGTISAPTGASAEAAAVMAAYGVLVSLFPGQAATLDVQRDASLAQIPNSQAKADGMAVGSAAAAAMLANRTGDGSTPPLTHTPTTSDPYEWQGYGLCTAGAFFHWQNVRPFAIESASQFRAEPPPPLVSGLYAQDFLEVQAVGGMFSTQRTQDRTDVARVYAVANPPSLWNAVLLQIAGTRNDDITDTARTMALMNMAVADASISVMETKYHYRTWRPITAILRGDEDGNLRTTAGAFTPLISTPCFPSYPSAHGSLSGAAERVLERAYGRFGHSITVSHPSFSGVVFNYSDLRDMINDISDARVYGGIHFRFDQNAGDRQGDAVAQFVYNHMLKRER